jgi:molecular chaperone DnaK
MTYSLGIDLGTTFSAVATVDETGLPRVLMNQEQKQITPSVIYFGTEGILVGDQAKEMQALGEEDVACFFKRDMGNPNFLLPFLGKDYSPVDLSTILLQKLRSDAEAALGCEVNKAVITVPAYFNNMQRQATIQAGNAAGLDVLRIINEPTAAALAFGMGKKGAGKKVLVYDLGGGTFDVTVAEITDSAIEVVATDGDHELGGKNWDDRILTYLAQRFRQDHDGIDPLEDPISFYDTAVRCEEAKKQLSSRDKTRVTISYKGHRESYELERAEFEEMTKDLMERTQDLTEQVLKESGMNWADFQGTLLVGGSTRMPMVKEYVTRMSGKEPMSGVNVDEAVALGAAIQASMDVQQEDHGAPKFTLPGSKEIRDVMSHSLGVFSENGDRSRYINSILIPKNKRIPCVESRPFQRRTQRGRDNEVEVYMLQGESDHPTHCIVLGKYIFSGIEHGPGGIAVLDIEYAYDKNGIVTVAATERSSGKTLPLRVDPVPDDMTWMELPPPEEVVVPVHISVALLIDVSYSMSGPPLTEAKQAAKAFMQKSDLSHTSIGVAEFGSDAKTIIEPTQNAKNIGNAVDRLSISGSTNMSDGIRTAYSMVRDAEDPRFIVLLTDGHPDDSAATTRAADEAKGNGIDIITIGTGGADDEYLKGIASSDENSVFAAEGSVVEAFSKIAQVLTETGGGIAVSDSGKKSKGLLRLFK